MKAKSRTGQPGNDEKLRRNARLVAELRENLRKRKAQARARQADEREEPPGDKDPAE